MSILTIVQNACRELSIPRPTTVVSNQDTNVQRVLRFVFKEGNAQVVSGYPWRHIVRTATFTAFAGENQGNINTLIGSNGYKSMLNNTMWNRTGGYYIRGAVYPEQWQAHQVYPQSSFQYSFRFDLDELYITPAPAVGDTIAFEYIARYWITDSTAATIKTDFTVDSDLTFFNEELLTQGAVWRYKKANGIEWQTDFDEYQYYVNMLKANDSPKMVLDFSTQDNVLTEDMVAGQFNNPVMIY